MTSSPSISEIAALVGNPARANVLVALMGGRALTASELAVAANVSPQTTSGHLASLTEGGLLIREKQGRHVYFRLASSLVGHMLEGIMDLSADRKPDRLPKWRGSDGLRAARTCYDHLAGKLGVALSDTLIARKDILLADDGGQVTRQGARFFGEFGIDLAGGGRQKRVFCRPCLDWSERRPHLAGFVGAALAKRCFDLQWIALAPSSRAVSITPAGREGYSKIFDIACLES
jgi:DNA-binding transcriptional ArsR family regulator